MCLLFWDMLEQAIEEYAPYFRESDMGFLDNDGDTEKQTFTASHSVSCPCPSCSFSTTGNGSSTESQADADSKAERACWDSYNAHSCPCAS